MQTYHTNRYILVSSRSWNFLWETRVWKYTEKQVDVKWIKCLLGFYKFWNTSTFITGILTYLLEKQYRKKQNDEGDLFATVVKDSVKFIKRSRVNQSYFFFQAAQSELVVNNFFPQSYTGSPTTRCFRNYWFLSHGVEKNKCLFFLTT